ncbi:hypothetical protein ACN27J_15845 [Solwaraspora sp. WMMB762]|uniref:hypothetical protein n=1 Tax=Solwaraspora sp. WMMB762 TaxID=3404120 RepID=UPI003B958F6B
MSSTAQGRVTVVPAPQQRRISITLAAIAALVAGLGGYQIGLARDRHSATAVVLTGTVVWSNEQTRLIAFDPDGVVREPDDGDKIYSVLTDNWQDAEGTVHSDESYPTCLATEGGEAVSMERHRAELTVIEWDTDGAQRVPIAVRVRCLS